MLINQFRFNILFNENFCAAVQVDIALVGTIGSYQDSACTINRTAFIVGRNAYYLVAVSSELGSIIQFAFTNVKQVNFIAKSSTTTYAAIALYDSGITDAANSVNASFVIIKRVNTNETSFGFAVTRALVNLATDAAQGNGLPKSSSINFYVSATVEIGYLDTSAKSGKKRLIVGYQDKLAEASSSTSDGSYSSPIALLDESVTTDTTLYPTDTTLTTSASSTSQSSSTTQSTSTNGTTSTGSSSNSSTGTSSTGTSSTGSSKTNSGTSSSSSQNNSYVLVASLICLLIALLM